MTLKQTILTLCLTIGLSAVAPSAHATIVRLRSSATVDKALIHLGDVADVFADDQVAATELQQITLSTSPIPGNSTRLKLDEIRSRLLKFDVEVGDLEFQGSSIVLVTRRGQLQTSAVSSPRTTLAGATTRTQLAGATNRVAAPQSFRKTELASYSTTSPRTVSNLREISTADIRLADTVIHDLVRNYLADWAPDWGTPIIRPLLAIPTVPTILSARSGNLKIVAGKLVSDDVFQLTVAVPTGEATPATGSSTTTSAADVAAATIATKVTATPSVTNVEVRVRVTRRPKVLAARRSIPQGQMIREADLEWREVDDLRNGTSEPEAIVGMEARRTIRQGDFVTLNTVKPPTLIKRDDLVKVAVTFGTVHVTRTLKARSDGILNDVIQLVPLEGTKKETLLVRVTGKGQAVPLDRELDADEPRIQLKANDG
jgi:flagella basal body P-ring formation protein FlgA